MTAFGTRIGRRAGLAALFFLSVLGVVLARSDDDPVPIADLVQALSDDSALVRKRAAIALQRLGSQASEAIPALQKALNDSDPAVRAAAAAALKAIGMPPSRDDLLNRLKDRQQPAAVRAAACQELARRFGQDPVVTRALETVLNDPAIKLEAARALEGMETGLKLERVTRGVTLKGHSEPVTCLAFSPDGKTLASGSGEGRQPGAVKLWDVAGAKERVATKGHTNGVTSLAFSPDGKTLASASGILDGKTDRWKAGEVKLWEVATGRERDILQEHESLITALAFTPDGKKLVTVGEDRSIVLWDVETGQDSTRSLVHLGSITALAVSPDSKLLATAGADRTVKLWSLPSGDGRGTLKWHSASVAALAFSPDGKTLASGTGVFNAETNQWSAGVAKILDVATGKERASFEKHTDLVAAVAFTPDGRALATGSWDSTVKIWDLPRSQERTTLTGHTSRVNAVAISGDGLLLASGSADRTVKLWHLVWEKQDR